VVDVAPDAVAIRAAVERWLASPRPEPDHVYGGGEAGARIAELLATVPLRFHKTITY
jgi:hypothetical protein